MNIEQRKCIRFAVQNNAFAALGSEFDKVGKVNDISQQGLALSYLVESNKAGAYRDFSKVDIFLSRNGLHLHKLPCKIVYDVQDSKSNNNNDIVKRRCGLHFGKINKSQSELLELFLKNYTTEVIK